MANLLEQVLDKAGLSRYTAKLKHALAGKQDKITGTKLKGGTVTGVLNVQAPTAAANPATKKYVDDRVGDIASILDSINGEVV